MLPCYLQLHVSTWWQYLFFLIALSLGIGAGRWMVRHFSLRTALEVTALFFVALAILSTLTGSGRGC